MAKKREKKEDNIPVNMSNTLEEGSTLRLRTLNELREKYHPMYLALNQYKNAQRLKILDELVSIYVPNVLRDFPFLLDKIEVQKKYIKHVEKERDEYLARANKAYSKLGLKISQFHDTWDPNLDFNENESDGKRKRKKQVE